ncbi:hypothetical protein FIBSPDRAFT_867681 [Athelia psychrophila]|uniref:DUF1772-domain-containing protein n=1 Tax=Athelia psychrophila TaxID=1759441 RepID=A0A166DU10_9AGAM|nr:hypothetical protein FIBSPDRAFT_867681 [Fibularhizoctonia sp. CBS 109695]
MNFSPLKVSLFTGVVSSSYFFFGNLGASNFGIVPAIRDEDGVDLSVAQKVALQSWHYDVAKFHMGGSGAVTTLSFALAGYLSRSRCMRIIMFSTAALSSLVIPWTLLIMQPVNKEIAELVDTQALEVAPGAERSPDQSLLEKRAMKKINTWRKLHMVRIVVGAGVWIGGLVSFSHGV